MEMGGHSGKLLMNIQNTILLSLYQMHFRCSVGAVVLSSLEEDDHTRS